VAVKCRSLKPPKRSISAAINGTDVDACTANSRHRPQGLSCRSDGRTDGRPDRASETPQTCRHTDKSRRRRRVGGLLSLEAAVISCQAVRIKRSVGLSTCNYDLDVFCDIIEHATTFEIELLVIDSCERMRMSSRSTYVND